MAKRKSPSNKKQSSKRRIMAWGVVLVTIIVAAAAVVKFHDRSIPKSGARQMAGPVTAAKFVGSQACVSCHNDEANQWRVSQHRDAMAEATEQTVLGNFNNATFTYAGMTSRFFRRDGGFYVRSQGPNGKPADFQIKYTFGVAPLQQYLVEFPDGRLQPLSIAWDTRPKTQGGRRWFHLYPGERIMHDDELFWTRSSQNWNFMCADCHSTGLRKNYDPATDRFQTQWAEIHVGCEACHGPGSRHLTWAESKRTGRPVEEDGDKGLTARLDERRDVIWSVDPATGAPARSRTRETGREIEVCAQCHSRRSQIADGYEAGKPYLDYYRPMLLMRPLYYVDGQQRGEVYDWGSFLQSKMYAKGVTCSDCHNPHSGKLRAEGNAVCTACHRAETYDTPGHHHHKPGRPGSSCAACHMPTATYMGVDPRHDHSLRVPRPDQSVSLGTPNACNGCHTKNDATWAAAQMKKWYAKSPEGYQQFAAAFSAADADGPDAAAQLRAIAGDTAQPPIVRATALADLDVSNNRASSEAAARGFRDPDPLVRLAALQSLASAPVNDRMPALPLLSDPVRTVRLEAVSVLAPVPSGPWNPEQRGAFERASAEYVETQRYNADRADARVNLGNFYASRGDAARAEEEMKSAIRLDPFFIPAYVNLADLYRATGRDAEGESLLRDGLTVSPKSAILHYSLGLALVRMKRSDDALAEFKRATTLEPDNARFAYVYAVALHSTGRPDAAMATLEHALRIHPNDRDILQALASYHSARGEQAKAKLYTDRLRVLAEGEKE